MEGSNTGRGETGSTALGTGRLTDWQRRDWQYLESFFPDLLGNRLGILHLALAGENVWERSDCVLGNIMLLREEFVVLGHK